MQVNPTTDQILDFANAEIDIFREFSDLMQHQVQNSQSAQLIDAALDNVSRVLSAGSIMLFDVDLRNGKTVLNPRRNIDALNPTPKRPHTPSVCLQDERLEHWGTELENGSVVYAMTDSGLPAERAYLRHRGIHSAAFIPLFVQGVLKGVVEVGDCAIRASHEELLPRVFQLLGTVLAHALEQERLTERFERIHAELFEIRVMRDAVQKQLQDVLEWKRTVFSNFAHEFQTPLYTLLGFSATLMENENLDEDREIRSVCLRHIYEQATRLENLVKDLTYTARLQDGPSPETFEEVSLRAMLTELLDRTALEAKERNVEQYLDAGNSPLQLRCDKARLTDMLAVLLENSLKATQSGGWISVRVTEDEQNIVLVISDNGIGIPKERLNTIFEPFADAFAATGDRAVIGLGLSRVKDIVDLHHGFITAESRQGEGSEFTIILPKDPRTASGKSP